MLECGCAGAERIPPKLHLIPFLKSLISTLPVRYGLGSGTAQNVLVEYINTIKVRLNRRRVYDFHVHADLYRSLYYASTASSQSIPPHSLQMH